MGLPPQYAYAGETEKGMVESDGGAGLDKKLPIRKAARQVGREQSRRAKKRGRRPSERGLLEARGVERKGPGYSSLGTAKSGGEVGMETTKFLTTGPAPTSQGFTLLIASQQQGFRRAGNRRRYWRCNNTTLGPI